MNGIAQPEGAARRRTDLAVHPQRRQHHARRPGHPRRHRMVRVPRLIRLHVTGLVPRGRLPHVDAPAALVLALASPQRRRVRALAPAYGRCATRRQGAASSGQRRWRKQRQVCAGSAGVQSDDRLLLKLASAAAYVWDIPSRPNSNSTNTSTPTPINHIDTHNKACCQTCTHKQIGQCQS